MMESCSAAFKGAFILTGEQERLIKVAIVHGDDTIARQVAVRLEKEGEFQPSLYISVPALMQANTQFDVLLVEIQEFARLYEKDPRAHQMVMRHNRVITLLNSQDLLAHAFVLSMVDAWIFLDLQFEVIATAIRLGQSGHSLVPGRFLSRLGVDEVRLESLPRLADTELDILQLLGQGLNNRSIAEMTQVSEAQIKSMVRSILSKLFFRNRTEAGVFAFRARAVLSQEKLRRGEQAFPGQRSRSS
jgi:DNA-binding NarL/FixJ family response regulator